jgi:hypothetical protein
MNFLYGDKNLLRVLDEAQFWKHQESEHTTVIDQIVPDLEAPFSERLYEFRNLLSQTEGEAVRLIESYIRSKGIISEELSEQIINYIHYAINESQNFLQFLDDIKQNSPVVQNDPVALVVIDHIMRESEYFSGIAQIVLYN